jgi:hypothetical protein
MIHLPQICLNFLDFFHRLGDKEILWEKGILEIVKGFLNKRLWKHCLIDGVFNLVLQFLWLARSM